MSDKKPEAEDIEWLRYFMDVADFGPAHEDVVAIYMRRFEEKTGKRVPFDYREGYINDEEDEE